VPVENTYEQAIRRRVKYFRGRQEQLKRIREYFTNAIEDECRVLVLQAMGGQGKSQIALEYCRQSRSTYSQIFWVNASSEATAVQSIERVAAEIGQPLTGIGDNQAKIRLAVQALARQNQRWLMVLDNYDDPDHFATIDRFIPSCQSHPFVWNTS
jgi:ATP/maltotriose-dependent transcriptional regulator MalT